MKFLVILATLLIAATADSGKRLIQFENKAEWMTVEQVEQLITAPGMHHFMDITDFKYPEVIKAVSTLPIPDSPTQEPYVRQLLPLANVDYITAYIAKLSEFPTRYYRTTTGVDAANWVRDRFEELAFARPDITVTSWIYSAYPQTSVIATIPGQGPNQASFVIIGAHLDSVGSTITGPAPGADDDASGTASLLEIFRVLAVSNYVPDFTLQFIAYAAEEGGLLGSQGIANAYLSSNIDVYAVLQLDMTGFNRNNASTTGIVTDFTSAELNAFVRQLVPLYTTLNWANYRCGYACSDHASWNRTGYRSAFTFETPYGSNPYIHSASDVLSYLEPEQLLQFVNLGIGFAVELAGVAPEK